MEEVTQKYVRFLLFISLYFSFLENAFCYTNESQYRPTNYSISYKNSPIFNVLDHGAKGNGVTNDAEAFKATWDAACKTRGGVMLIPSKRTFLLQPVKFEGSYCQPNVVVQLDGNIVAPNKRDFSNIGEYYWILFEGLSKGIQIKGNNGIIDGRGASWWGTNKQLRSPHALGIVKSVNVIVAGITIKNSPRMHIYIGNSQQVQIYNFAVQSPGNSPNTDGIHISGVQHAKIHDSNLACGDDCISIQSGCSDVTIYNVHCGPGHGYSIGGLGPNKEVAYVSDISIYKSTVHDALNGVRIKTWQDGSGSVRGIIFSGIKMWNVENPIVIDQEYCGGHDTCIPTDRNAVAIYNVSYTNIWGTYSSKPISLTCSKFVPCRGLTFTNIGITPTSWRAKKPAMPYGFNAYGRYWGTIIPSLKNCVRWA